MSHPRALFEAQIALVLRFVDVVQGFAKFLDSVEQRRESRFDRRRRAARSRREVECERLRPFSFGQTPERMTNRGAALLGGFAGRSLRLGKLGRKGSSSTGEPDGGNQHGGMK